LSGRTSLPVLGAVLARLDCYATNDSGPMHMAWAQGTPVTAVFGPTVESLGFAPRGSGSTVVQADLPCRPCGLHGHTECPQGHFSCMRSIDPETVWRDVERKIDPGSAR
ncbi:MAG: glycosyltransferase family 9 protein, partial [Mailhella sp.]|nr:glycosyltransferase family 9 protein [Mailhella sp.]